MALRSAPDEADAKALGWGGSCLVPELAVGDLPWLRRDREDFPGVPGSGPIRRGRHGKTLEGSDTEPLEEASHGQIHRARRHHAPGRRTCLAASLTHPLAGG